MSRVVGLGIQNFEQMIKQKEKSLAKTVENAFLQIEARDYASGLREKGIPNERIRKYGFAFEGKTVLIGFGNIFEFPQNANSKEIFPLKVPICQIF